MKPLTQPQRDVLAQAFRRVDYRVYDFGMLPVTRNALCDGGWMEKRFILSDNQRIEEAARAEREVATAREIIGHDWRAALRHLQIAASALSERDFKADYLTEQALREFADQGAAIKP